MAAPLDLATELLRAGLDVPYSKCSTHHKILREAVLVEMVRGTSPNPS